MDVLQIYPGKEISLSDLTYNDIFLRRVESARNEFKDLMSILAIKSQYTDGRTVETPFHPSSYVSLRNPMAITQDFVKAIRNCKHKTISMKAFEQGAKLIIYYEQAKFKIEKIIINCVNQFDGTTYSLHPNSFKEIQNFFRDAIPVKSMFVAHHVRISFQSIYGSIFFHIILTLTGLQEEQLDLIKDIIFLEPSTGKIKLSLYDENGE